MTSKELVRRTLEFDAPDRIPRQMWLLPWAHNMYPDQVKSIAADYPDDIVGVQTYGELPRTQGDAYKIGTYVDEWGCVFESVQDGIIGEVKEPIIGRWEDMSRMREPVEMLDVNKEKVNEFCRGTDKFVMAGCFPRPFERLQFLRGTQNVMMDLAMGSDELFALLDRIHQFNLKELRAWAVTDVDALMFMDDWGAQRSLLISPDMWRQYFKPLYKEYIDIAKAHGKKTFMHSDGYIVDIIDDLIEVGLDALNSQIFCMGLDELERFKGRITFWGEIDRQHLLPHASCNEIRDGVDKTYRSLYSDSGIIAQLEFGPGAKPENVTAAFDAWNKYGSSAT